MGRRGPGCAVWEITLNCNLQCLHCGSAAGTARSDELSTEEALRLCTDLKAIDCQGVALMGGEPGRRSNEIGLNGELLTVMTLAILSGLLAFCGLLVGLLLCATTRSARTLDGRCASELAQLKSLLSGRHLIASHLADSIPASLDGLYERRKFEIRLRRAEEGLRSLDPYDPNPKHLRAIEDNEQSLVELIEDLTDALDGTDAATRIQAVSGCLEGLEKATSEIRDAVSTYNAATITYTSFLSTSLVARLQKLEPRFEILDLEPPGSSMSGDSGLSSDRVAS